MRVTIFALCGLLIIGAVACPASTVFPDAADKDKAKAEEEKKRKADEAKKKAEDAKKRAEEEKKKQDDVANWKAKDFDYVKSTGSAFCVYIKDPDPKKNVDASHLEGKDVLGNSDVRLKLRAFARFKIKNDSTDSKGWPTEWLQRAENGAALVLVSSDGREMAIFDHRTPKAALTTTAFEAAIDTIFKHEAELKAAAEKKAKDEAARAREEAARAAAANPPEKQIPGLTGNVKKSEKTDKPKKKDPQDE